MLKKTAAAAVLSATALLGATPALADGYRHAAPYGKRFVAVQDRTYHGYHRAYERRTVIVHRHAAPARPVVVVRERHSHDVLGGLIVGAMLGAVIASQGGY